MIERKAEREIELLESLLQHVETASEQEVEGWMTAAVTAEERRLILQDEREFQEELLSQAGQLAIVGLNQVVELNTRHLLRALQPPPKEESLHKQYYLRRYLRRYFNIRLNLLTEYRAISEIREISNAAKHSGTVTKKLSQFPGWVRGKPLGDVSGAFVRLKSKAPLFLQALEFEVCRVTGP